LALKEGFRIRENGHLTFREIDLIELCDKYGTPLFVFDKATLEESFEKLRHAFENVYPNTMVCYSIKTNDNLAICQTLREKGAYAELSSELDLHVALRAGFRGENMIFDGPCKPSEVLKKAMEESVRLINVESFQELETVNRIAGEMGVKQAVGIRVNPFKDPGLSKYVHLNDLVAAAYCNLESRFGMSVEDTYLAIRQATTLKNLKIEALMAHPYRVSTKVLLPMMRVLSQKFGVEIKYLDIGGGFFPGGARFIGNQDLIKDLLRRKIGLASKLAGSSRATNIESVAKSVANEIRQSIGDSSEPTIIVEPGRFIASASGILLTRVDNVKNSGGYKWAFVDAGTNLLPRFGVGPELRKIIVANKAADRPEEEVNVVGPLLYSDDYITLKTILPRVSEGDILFIFDCGAYTLSRSSQFLHPRPAAVMLDSKGNVRVIRERETPEDVLYKDRTI
jgi:diaminopimelate decarboxylase